MSTSDLFNGKELDSMIGFVSEVRPTIVVLTTYINDDYDVVCYQHEVSEQSIVEKSFIDRKNGVYIFYPSEYDNYIIQYTNNGVLVDNKEETIIVDKLCFYHEIDWQMRIKNLEVGSSLYLPVNHDAVENLGTGQLEFVVLQQGRPDAEDVNKIYPDSCDGTWVMLKSPIVTSAYKSFGKLYYGFYSDSVSAPSGRWYGNGFYKYQYTYDGSESIEDMESSTAWFNDSTSGVSFILSQSLPFVKNINLPYIRTNYKNVPPGSGSKPYVLDKPPFSLENTSYNKIRFFSLSVYEIFDTGNFSGLSSGNLPKDENDNYIVDGKQLDYFENDDERYSHCLYASGNSNNKYWLRTPSLYDQTSKTYGTYIYQYYCNDFKDSNHNNYVFGNGKTYIAGNSTPSDSRVMTMYFRPCCILKKNSFYTIKDNHYSLDTSRLVEEIKV